MELFTAAPQATPQILETSQKMIAAMASNVAREVTWGLKSFNISISRINNSTSSGSNQEGECKFPIILEKIRLLATLRGAQGVKNWKQVPVILDWRIPNSTFGKLERDESPTFTSSHCKSDESGFFICSCKEKYQGNPSFLLGCQDINECQDGTAKCSANMHCENFEGGYVALIPVEQRDGY
ncbi:hypothetical protein CUMW_265180 [Citrus unshiu]|uniref:NOTCH1 EGF-like calcium-binding domain-containing protein n=2 Tax=Citrus unshiu TaxID=55188 RepID=A0A2H5QVG6_CITUN|nr:hypothetical protein CUMW_265180 [Citrus unshiu]